MSKSRDLADSANVINFLDNLTEDVNSSLTAKLSTSSNLSDLTDADVAVVNLGLTATATELNTLDGITATTTELNYTDGVTSNIQTQLDTKLASASYTASDVLTKIKTVDGTGSGLDADTLDGNEATAFATAAQGTLADSAVQNLGDLSITATATELNYTDGVTSNIQTQLNSKATATSVTSEASTRASADTALDTRVTTAETKLSGIESGATADQTAAEILTAIKTVDGTGSGLDADTLDGNQATAFATAAQGTKADSAVQNLGDLSITATAAELNKLDGVTATTAELNYTDGVTSNIQTQLNGKATSAQGALADSAVQNLADLSITATAAEINKLDGYTGGVTELNYLDTLHATGVTSTEFDYLDGVTSNIQTQLDEKIPVQDTVYTLTGTNFDVSNGGIQVKILSQNTTFTESLNSGESLVLQIENATTYTVTWPTITWTTSSGNVAPTLTAKDALVLWKVSSTLYGAVIGSYV